MSTLAAIAPFHDDLIALRREVHAHPKLGLDVSDTAATIARRLTALDIGTTKGIDGHGIVGTIRGAENGPAIASACRAEMASV